MTNKEISSAFKLLAQLIELHGGDSFKAKTYSNASFQIGRLGEPITEMEDAILSQQRGVGKAVFSKTKELLETGTISQIEEYLEMTPPGVLDLLKIKGIGAKKIRLLWDELGIESVGELLYACNENRLIELKGFGVKTQQSIIEQIEFIDSNAGKYLYAQLEDYGNELVKIIDSVQGVEEVMLTGQMRRKMPDVDHIEFLIRSSVGPEVLNEVVGVFEGELEWEIDEESAATVLGNGLKITLWSSDDANWNYDLLYTTGINSKIEEQIGEVPEDVGSEEEAFSAMGMPFIVPEMREELAYPEISEEDLITTKDVKGVVHNHSTWSDGLNSVEEMANECIKSGYEYLVMSDHSKTAVYAGGLSIDDIHRQQEEIDALNQKLAPFKIFKSIESDILNDGSLDYPDEVLDSFDFVIASVHSGLKMDEEKAMMRLQNAIEHPVTRILGHPTGRLMLAREGYPVDHEKMIELCAKNNVVIELNANPHRLDLDWRWIPKAMEAGVKISINPDAHNLEGIKDIRHGVYTARKGGLTKDMTLNALGLEDFSHWISG